MGKPYESELAALPRTYRWAMKVPINAFASAVAGAAGLPLIAVGSGGSFTSAVVASSLHQHFTGIPSKAVTPLEFVSGHFNPRDTAVMFASAGGNNADIITCFKNAIFREPARCIALSLQADSGLARMATRYSFVDGITTATPPCEDGFLATNSLLALVILLSRAYSNAFGMDHGFPQTLNQLVPFQDGNRRWDNELHGLWEPLWQKDTLLVLFSPELHAAGLDIESKFSEAALGTIQLADFRNFAHGRHNWLAKRGDSTGVLALLTERDSDLAAKTLSLLPEKVPIAKTVIPTTTVGATNAAAIVAALHVVGSVGASRGIDPGRPGVPEFGRRIYNLRGLQHVPTVTRPSCTTEDIAIARKLRCDVAWLANQNSLELRQWQQAYRAFVSSFEMTQFGGIVFDYDGTLCGRQHRFSGLIKQIANVLTRLAKRGIAIGIVTGRGKSVRRDLQRQLPRSIWGQVLIGYYNGAIIGMLSDNHLPEAGVAPTSLINDIAAAINVHTLLGRRTMQEARNNQLSLQPKIPGTTALVWKIAGHLTHSFPGVRAVISSHSVDLLAPGVSKRLLVDQVQKRLSGKQQILVIGDMGAWPGNDFELLSLPYSLSVDEVSADPCTCWNLAPLGYRGPQAVRHYLDALLTNRNGFSVDCTKLCKSRLVKEGE